MRSRLRRVQKPALLVRGELEVVEFGMWKDRRFEPGIQKEAYIFKVPCITLREDTEWVETVENGWNVLVGANDDAIIKMANGFEPEGEQGDVFGSGDANERIREIIGRGEHEKN